MPHDSDAVQQATLKGWDTREDQPAFVASMEKRSPMDSWLVWLQGAALIVCSMGDNALCWATFLMVTSYEGNLYNIVQLHIELLPGIDIALGLFAALGSLTFVAMVVLVECFKMPLFHETMNFRLLVSACPCYVICMILLAYCETTEFWPFITLMAITLTVFLWCVHMRITYSYQLNILSKISLDVSWFMALLFAIFLVSFYLSDSIKYVTNSEDLNCPYAENVEMPVYSFLANQWHCSPWDSKSGRTVTREASGSLTQLSCSSTFTSAFGNVITANQVNCPSGCLALWNAGSADVVGCGIYSTDTPICIAAIHAGVLTDNGGIATAFGRLGVSIFDSCSLNSVVSSERSITTTGTLVTVTQATATAPEVTTSDGVAVPQAFHFNNFANSIEYLWLRSYDEVSSNDEGIDNGKPWTRIDADVSSRIAGLELERERIRLGGNADRAQVAEADASTPSQCRIYTTGVRCEGNGQNILQLDFCEADEKTCLTR
uniref:LCCL domain-containing protein n=1 Tax=Noctiluca scintillans TaxID=2966 RepID=A0A7S1A3C6_NOCSC